MFTSHAGGDTDDRNTWGGSIRGRTTLAQNWGVDLEFARSAEFETQPDVGILQTASLIPEILPFPAVTNRQQLSTLTTTLWWRQELSERLQLIYLGGAAFTRTSNSFSYSFVRFTPSFTGSFGGVTLLPEPQFVSFESVFFDAGVVAGMDARIGTDRLRFVPGVRILTVGEGWVVRPSAGVQWAF